MTPPNVSLEKGREFSFQSNRPQPSEGYTYQSEEEACDSNPFCFNGESSFVPTFRVGYEGVVGAEFFGQGNVGIKFLFYNRKHWIIARRPSEHSLGIGPDLQYHTHSDRHAGSFGVAIRYLKTPKLSYWTGLLSWGVDLSLRGGIGYLELEEDGVPYEGDYNFFAADLSLFGGAYFLSGHVGIGLRKEFWPEGTNSIDQGGSSPGPDVYPAFTFGIGIF